MSSNANAEPQLERLPNGEHAYLRPETAPLDRYRLNPDRVVIADDEPEDVRYVLTDQGRRDLAMARLFGPWPTVAEVLP